MDYIESHVREGVECKKSITWRKQELARKLVFLVKYPSPTLKEAKTFSSDFKATLIQILIKILDGVR